MRAHTSPTVNRDSDQQPHDCAAAGASSRAIDKNVTEDLRFDEDGRRVASGSLSIFLFRAVLLLVTFTAAFLATVPLLRWHLGQASGTSLEGRRRVRG